jgi:hypothetical protein
VVSLAGSVLVLLSACNRALAQWGPEVQEPQWLRLQVHGARTDVNVEGQEVRRRTAGVKVRQSYLLAEPSLGVGLRGSLYHPNLLAFDLDFEDGLSWQGISIKPPGGEHRTTRFLRRYQGGVDLFNQKPFASRLFGQRGVSYRNLDFFSRGRVESERRGANSGLASGPVPFSVGFERMHEELTGAKRDTDLRQDLLSANARNLRGVTSMSELTYLRNRFRRREEGLTDLRGLEQSATLFDRESFGHGQRSHLNSSALFHRLDGGPFATRSLTFIEDLYLDHRPDLSTRYAYSYSDRRTNGVRSRTHDGNASLRHVLYGSLESLLGIHGSRVQSGGPDLSADEAKHGVRADERYTRNLGSTLRLEFGYGVLFERESRESEGDVLVVIDEPHILRDDTVVYLNHPEVISVDAVADSMGLPYARALDYDVFPRGALTEIRRIPGGRIPDGGRVFVDYSAARADPGWFTRSGRSAHARLELFRRALVFHSRRRTIDHDGGGPLVLEDLTDTVHGAELSWRWLHVGGEYQKCESNLSPHRTMSLFESLNLDLTGSSTFSLDLSQIWIRLPGDDDRERNTIIGRLRVWLSSDWRFYGEGGLSREIGAGADMDLATARTDLEFGAGQLRMNAGYEFEDQTYLKDERRKHVFSMRARRSF